MVFCKRLTVSAVLSSCHCEAPATSSRARRAVRACRYVLAARSTFRCWLSTSVREHVFWCCCCELRDLYVCNRFLTHSPWQMRSRLSSHCPSCKRPRSQQGLVQRAAVSVLHGRAQRAAGGACALLRGPRKRRERLRGAAERWESICAVGGAVSLFDVKFMSAG
jgi:hypothetical protein